MAVIHKIRFTVRSGRSVGDAIRLAIYLAGETRASECSFTHNGVTVVVDGDSEYGLIRRDYHRAIIGSIGKRVGPHPKPVLSEEELATDKRARARLRRRVENDKITAARKRQIAEQVAEAPEFAAIDPEKWNWAKTVSLRYTKDELALTERWARLMQLELSKGNELRVSAVETLELASYPDDPSRYTREKAINILRRYWQHGAELASLYEAAVSS